MPTVSPSPQPGSLLLNLQRLFWLRNIAIAGQAMAVLVTQYGLHMPLRLLPLGITIAVLAVLNGLGWVRIHRFGQRWPASDAEVCLQLLVDVLALSVLLYFTGGSTNPFVSLYLMPIAIAAAVVRPAYVWFMAGVTSLCYSFLLVWYVPLPHFHYLHGEDGSFSLHVIGMWFTFMLAAVLMAFFVVRMAASLRERDRQLARVREENLRNEQVIGLATLAAGAAHELGTPLSTIAVLARELEETCAGNPALLADVRTIQGQIGHCKAILGRLSAAAGNPRAEGGSRQSLDAVLEEVAEAARLLRPGMKLQLVLEGPRPAPQVVVDVAFVQAIQNLLGNAAQASPADVCLQADWSAGKLLVRILDRGPGLTPEVLQRAGEAFFTTRSGEGFGIGVFLANVTVERLGGTVHFENREGGGACVTVTVPLAAIEVAS